MAKKSASDISTVLAGWLLGCEFASATTMYPELQDVTLIASPTLQPWYERVALSFGIMPRAGRRGGNSERALADRLTHGLMTSRTEAVLQYKSRADALHQILQQ